MKSNFSRILRVLTLSSLFLFAIPAFAQVSQVTYTPSSATFPNPERGFYSEPYCDSNTVSLSTLQGYRANNGRTVVRCLFRLNNYKTTALPQSALDTYQAQMNTIRAAGFKTVVRFAYSWDSTGADAAPSVVLNHIAQLQPFFTTNSDIITSIEAGFVGGWGEWAFSTNFGSYSWGGVNTGLAYNLTAQNWADRKAVVDKLLQVVPSKISVQLRTPLIKTTMYGTAALTSSEAFNGSAKSRLGHHNDCFLSGSTDSGTYANTSVEYPYLAQETKYLPMSGETCKYNPPRSDCTAALDEASKFHWSQMNEGYHAEVIAGWKTQGCFATIQQKLGYRLVLVNGSYSGTANPGGT
jgi:hypothetical protein